MPDAQLLQLLAGGVAVWNPWLRDHPDLRPDLRGADLRGWKLAHVNLGGAELDMADLSEADLTGADLHDTTLTGTKFRRATLCQADVSRSFGPAADFSGAVLRGASLGESKFAGVTCDGADLTAVTFDWSLLPGASFVGARAYRADFAHSYLMGATYAGAKLQGANFYQANLAAAKFPDADLRGTCLARADLAYADFSRADLRFAHLEQAALMETVLEKAQLSGSHVYGIAVWDVIGQPSSQLNLVIKPPERDDVPAIIVEDLEIAQFVYLLTKHHRLRKVLNAVTERGVLLLGPFDDGGLPRLQAIAGRLRTVDPPYLPIIFDFKRQPSRTYTETVKTLVGLSRFVIVDLSGPSVPKELEATVPHFKIPFVPIVEKGRAFASMLRDFFENDWVLKPPIEFSSQHELLELLPEKIIKPAEDKHRARQASLDALYGPADLAASRGGPLGEAIS